jgi:ribosomal protein L7Ae-like RNA K-turn-binding protein
MAGPERILNLLGLGARAGSVLPGTERVREAVRHGDVQFVILAADASDTQRYKLLPLLDSSGVSYTTRFERTQLGIAIGRSPVSAVGVVDPALAKRIRTLLEEIDAAEEQHNGHS